ncbi:biotin transporter BioY [Desulfothermobacter acidiphilus]|uniref:biotin transporter BioY n=1 Tax=Desulfothermobacter acidiphilus TaxID=1938353 RepID=UPI003F88CDAB
MLTSSAEKLTALRERIFDGTRNSALPVQILLGLLGAAFIGVAAQIRIPLPFTPVPITGQTFAILFLALLLGTRAGTLSSGFYVLLGTLGIPWFAGLKGGWSVLAGPTGGYLIGFILAALLVGYLCDNLAWARRLPWLIAVLLVANFVVIHGLGVFWLGMATGVHNVAQLLLMGSIPFIPGDLLKIAAAAGLGRLVLPQPAEPRS